MKIKGCLMVANKVTRNKVLYKESELKLIKDKEDIPICYGYENDANIIGTVKNIYFEENKLIFNGEITKDIKEGDSIGPTFKVGSLIEKDGISFAKDIELISVNYCGKQKMSLDELKIIKVVKE